MSGCLSRRRVLLVAGARKSHLITVLTPGDPVYVTESGALVPFIYLGLNTSGNVVVMRAFCLPDQVQFNTVGNKPEYSGSNLDKWLLNTVRQRYPLLRRYMAESSITNSVYDDSFVESVVTINRDIYVPSFYEVTGSGKEGGINYLPVLKTYKNTSSNNSARNANNTPYWLRSEFSSGSYPSRINIVEGSGACTRNQSFQPSNSVSPKARPIISLLQSTPIFSIDGRIIAGG